MTPYHNYSEVLLLSFETAITNLKNGGDGTIDDNSIFGAMISYLVLGPYQTDI